MAFASGDLLMTRANWRDGLILVPHKSGTARAVRCRFFVTGDMANGFILRPEGDARRHVTFAVPRYLQPRQGWLTFGASSGGGAVLAAGYFLPALQAESQSGFSHQLSFAGERRLEVRVAVEVLAISRRKHGAIHLSFDSFYESWSGFARVLGF